MKLNPRIVVQQISATRAARALTRAKPAAEGVQREITPEMQEILDKKLRDAIIHRNTTKIRRLVSLGADLNSGVMLPVLVLAAGAMLSGSKIVKALLELGADVNGIATIIGETALMEASLIGNVEAVNVLLEHGADVTVKDKRGRTALFIAQVEGLTEIEKLLRKYGAEI